MLKQKFALLFFGAALATSTAVSVAAAAPIPEGLYTSGVTCEGANGKALRYTTQGVAVSPNFGIVPAVCPINPVSLFFSGASDYIANIKDAAGSMVTCNLRQHAANGTSGAILGSAMSDGTGTAQSLAITPNPSVMMDPSTSYMILECLLPTNGAVFSHGPSAMQAEALPIVPDE